MRTPRRKLYLDTSILGFALQRFDLERRAEANLLLRQIRQGDFVAGYSFVTEAEIEAAPPSIAQRLRRKITSADVRRIRVRSRSQAHDLAERYCRARIIPHQFF